MNFTLTKKAILIVAVPLLFELAFVAELSTLLHQVEGERIREARAREVSERMNNVLQMMLIRLSDKIMSRVIPGLPEMANPDEVRRRLSEEFEKLFEITKDNPHERAVIMRIVDLVQEGDASFTEAKRYLDEGHPEKGLNSAIELQIGLKKIFKERDALVEEQQTSVLEGKKAQAIAREQVENVLKLAVLFNIVVAVVLAVYLYRGIASRIKVLMENTARLASDQPLKPPVAGNDEIAHLDRVFREMGATLTELRRKERAVIENASEVICSLDENVAFTAVNPASRRVWGRDPDDMIGTRLAALVADADKERSLAAIRNIISSAGHGVVENRIKRQDGTLCDMEWSAQWSQAEKSLFCVARDISDRKEIDRLKREFIAMVSHDLKTPLTSIQMVHSLLAAEAYGELTDDGHENLAMADENVARLMKLVNDLLELEKMESGRLELHQANVSVREIVDSSIRTVKGFADKQGIGLEVLKGEEAIVYADADRTVQVLVNFLSNAIKFSPPHGTVSVTVNSNSQRVRVSVADEGRGIPPNMVERIFERFKQVQESDAKEKGGSGLGLAICREIIEQHQGKIGLSSEEGRGSTFWFELKRVS